MCYSFDIALDLCSEIDIRSKVYTAFNHNIHKPLSVTQVDSVFLLYFNSLVPLLLMANTFHHI